MNQYRLTGDEFGNTDEPMTFGAIRDGIIGNNEDWGTSYTVDDFSCDESAISLNGAAIAKKI